MTTTQAKEKSTTRLMDTIEDAGNTSLEAVRKLANTVNGMFPDVAEDGPRRQIIDSAFKMTEQLVSTSTALAKNILEVTEKALGESDQKSSSSGQ